MNSNRMSEIHIADTPIRNAAASVVVSSSVAGIGGGARERAGRPCEAGSNDRALGTRQRSPAAHLQIRIVCRWRRTTPKGLVQEVPGTTRSMGFMTPSRSPCHAPVRVTVKAHWTLQSKERIVPKGGGGLGQISI